MRTIWTTCLFATLLASLVTATAHAAPAVPDRMTFTARLSNAGAPVTGTHDFEFVIYDDAVSGSKLWAETHQIDVAAGFVAVELGGSEPFGGVFDGSARWLAVSVDGSPLDGRVEILSVPHALRAAVAAVAEAVAPGLQAQLDAAYLKKGASLMCAGTDKVVGVNAATGNVICAADVGGTSYTPGFGLTLTSGVFAVDTTTVQKRVTGTCVGNTAIGTIGADGSVTCKSVVIPQNSPGGGILVNTDGANVASFTIANLGVTTVRLANAAVTTDKLADGAVSTAKIADDAVTGAVVADGTIGADDVALPSGMGNAGAALTLTAGTLNNRQYPVDAFVSTSAMTCMVTANVLLSNAGAQASGDAFLDVAFDVNGSLSSDTAMGLPASAYGPGGKASISKTIVTTVPSGATIKFGCQLSVSGDYVGDSMTCLVSYLCQ